MRKRLVEEDRFLLKELLRLVVDPSLFERERVCELVPADQARHNGYRDLPFLVDHKERARRVFVPSRREPDHAPHDPLGIEKIVQLVFQFCHFSGYFPGADMKAPEDRIDRVLGLHPAVLKGSLELPAHDSSRHIEEGVLEHLLIIQFSETYLLVKPTHSVSLNMAHVVCMPFRPRMACLQ